MDTAMPEIKEAFAGIKRMSQQAETGKGLLPALLNDEKMYEDFKASLAHLSASLDRLDALTKSAREGQGLVARLVSDEQLANNFADAVKSLKAIAARLESGDNTLARLSRDDDMYKDMKKVLADARETLRSVKEQVPLGTFASVLLNSF